MTAIQLLWISSVGGAVLFFAAGALASSLRNRRTSADVESDRLLQLRSRVEAAEAERAQLIREVEASRQRDAVPPPSHAKELDAARARVAHAEAEAARVVAAERQAREAEAVRAAAAERQAREAETARAAVERKAREELAAVRHELAQASQAPSRPAVPDQLASRLRDELAQVKNELVGARNELGELQAKSQRTEQQLVERGRQLEVVKRRAHDAEAMRAEYVRLKSEGHEASFLKTEVERLQRELVSMRSVVLTGTKRASKPLPKIGPPVVGSITDALAEAIERFSGPQVRAVAVADTVGFPLASSGEDGGALAGYAALLYETANRAHQFLPISAPVSIELVDANHARVSVWTFDIESDHLLLVSVGVDATDTAQVDSTLAELTTILTPRTSRSVAG